MPWSVDCPYVVDGLQLGRLCGSPFLLSFLSPCGVLCNTVEVQPSLTDLYIEEFEELRVNSTCTLFFHHWICPPFDSLACWLF